MTARTRASRSDQRTRDHVVDSGYHFERRPEDRGLTVLGIVCRDAEEFAGEFEKAVLGQDDLFKQRTERDVLALLLGWEERRFGKADRTLQSVGNVVYRFSGADIWANPFRCADEVLRAAIAGVNRMSPFIRHSPLCRLGRR